MILSHTSRIHTSHFYTTEAARDAFSLRTKSREAARGWRFEIARTEPKLARRALDRRAEGGDRGQGLRRCHSGLVFGARPASAAAISISARRRSPDQIRAHLPCPHCPTPLPFPSQTLRFLTGPAAQHTLISSSFVRSLRSFPTTVAHYCLDPPQHGPLQWPTTPTRPRGS